MKKEQEPSLETVADPVERLPDYAGIRASQGIELKDVSYATKIRSSYLDAIEKGEFEKLPEPIYAETFIKTYAGKIGVDSAILLSHYRRYLETIQASLRNPNVQRERRPHKTELVRPGSSFKVSFKMLGWIVSGFVAIGFLISFLSTHVHDENQPDWVQTFSQPKPSNPDSSVNHQVAVDPGSNVDIPSAAGNAASPNTTTPAAASAKTPYTLVIEATETSWVNIVEDDNPPYDVLLRAGERLEREASEKFSIDIGNAGGVSVNFQGKALGRLGQRGQVVHLTLPDEGQE